MTLSKNLMSASVLTVGALLGSEAFAAAAPVAPVPVSGAAVLTADTVYGSAANVLGNQITLTNVADDWVGAGGSAVGASQPLTFEYHFQVNQDTVAGYYLWADGSINSFNNLASLNNVASAAINPAIGQLPAALDVSPASITYTITETVSESVLTQHVGAGVYTGQLNLTANTWYTITLDGASGPASAAAAAASYINFGGAEPITAVPVPAAAWLFGSALVGLAGIGRKRKSH